MITAKRLRERQAADAVGKPAPTQPLPETISAREHDAEVSRLNKAHAAEMVALREQVAQLTAENTELKSLLEQARQTDKSSRVMRAK